MLYLEKNNSTQSSIVTTTSFHLMVLLGSTQINLKANLSISLWLEQSYSKTKRTFLLEFILVMGYW